MKDETISLRWHPYKMFPYETKLAYREINTLLKSDVYKNDKDQVIVCNPQNIDNASRLVFFSEIDYKGRIIPTKQKLIETTERKNFKRQNTRYSVHGLHEYKGKFNPQIVKVLFNIFSVDENSLVLDPFCGSGTSLVEAALNNITAKGTDINPLAVFIANTKIAALNLTCKDLSDGKKTFFERYEQVSVDLELKEDTDRIKYLRLWFPEDILYTIEAFKKSAHELNDSLRNVFLALISNILREYSYQEPSDLRIRRRYSPFPEETINTRINNLINSFIENLADYQKNFPLIESENKAVNIDIKSAHQRNDFIGENLFDFAISSPPYATALPYIDTQRLSLVWLDMISPDAIKTLESELIGSREFQIKSALVRWTENLQTNAFDLPEEVHSFCLSLFTKIKDSDGFRKKAVPALLYRYFADMKSAFKEVYRMIKEDKYFCLIVGHNHTKIGGERSDINTPFLLSCVGQQIGFHLSELTELDAYQRYGLNSSNAVQRESLLVFKK